MRLSSALSAQRCGAVPIQNTLGAVRVHAPGTARLILGYAGVMRSDHLPLLAHHTATVTKPTTLTLLKGMRIAAMSGVMWPATARETPVML